MDLVAERVKMDPAERAPQELHPAPTSSRTRRPRGWPTTAATTGRRSTKALDLIGYQRLREFQKQGPKDNRYLGMGLSTYVEICGLGPSKVAGAVGFQGGLWESATVRMHPTGKATVFTGISPHGQGEETTFAQIVADELGTAGRRHRGRPRRHRRRLDGLGDVRQPLDRRRRRGARDRRAPRAREGDEDRRPHAGGGRGGRDVRPGPLLRPRQPRPASRRSRR